MSQDEETLQSEEITPLLANPESEFYDSYGASVNALTSSISNNVEALIDEQSYKLSDHTTVVNELKFISRNAPYLVVTFILQYSLNMFATFFVSRLGTPELGAISLSISTFYITGPCVINGASSCLDTLCSQTFSAKNYRLMTLYMQRFTAMMLCSLIPMFCVWHTGRFWLKYLIPDPTTLELTARFLQIASFGSPLLLLFEVGKRYLQLQGIFHATFQILLITLPINCTVNYLLLWNEHTRVGFVGAPILLVISWYIMATLLYSYIYFVNGTQYWTGFEPRNCFRQWGTLFRLAIPGILMIISELLAFELLTFFSSQIGVAGLASQSVVSLLASFLYQLPFSMSVVCSTRIAHYIGLNYKEALSVTVKAAFLCSSVAAVINFSWIYYGRYILADVFSDDDEVKKLVVQVAFVVSLIQTFDCINVICAGCLRGQGRQRIGSIFSFMSYFVIGTPLEVLLGFHLKMGVWGLWVGLAVGVGLLTLAEFLCVLFTDWDSVIYECNKRNSSNNQ